MAVRKDQIQITVDIEAQQGVREYQKLLDATRNVNNEMRKLKRQGKENSDEFKKLQQEAGRLNGELNKLGGAGANFAQLLSRSKQLNREMKSLVPGTKRFIEVTKELKTVNTRLADIRAQTRGVKQGLEEVTIAGVKLPGAVGKIAGAFKGFIALQVVQYLIQIGQVLNDTTQRFQKLIGQIGQATGAVDQQLNTYASRISAIAVTFQKETDEVTNAANALSKQLGIDFAQSLDLIEKGFLAGADRSGDFLSQIKEYPTFFREAGLSGEQFISLISQQVQEGVFSDKGVDLIKEFTLRIRELTPATQKALEGIGITSEEIGRIIDEDGIGGAFTTVQEKLRQIEDTAPETGAALADIFGGPGEDAGVQFIENLQLTDDALEQLINRGGEYTRALADQLRANQELAEAQIRVTENFNDTSNSLSVFITQFKTLLFNIAGDVIKFFGDLPARAAGVQAAFQQILENIGGFFERTKIQLSITLKEIEKLNPFGKTTEQLNQEIQNLQNSQSAIADAAGNVGLAYMTAYLDSLENQEQRAEIAKALAPVPQENIIRERARETAKKMVDIQAEELAKIQAERAGDANLLAPLPGIGGTRSGTEEGGAASDGSAPIDTTAQEELLKNQFLKALISEQEYEDQRFLLQQEAYNRRLEYLRQKFGEESAAYVALENEKLENQMQYEQERQDLTERTEQARQAAIQGGLTALGGFVEETIGLLKSEEGERKKNSIALKAFSAGKVLIDTQEAIMAIIKNAQSNPSNILFPGAGDIIAGVKIAGVVAKSAVALSRIRSTSFYDGGPTGNKVLIPDAHGGIVGGVHKNEWVAPEWQTKHPVYGPVIGWLENMRQNGFVDGGFVGTETSPAAAAAGQGSPLLNTKVLEDMMREVRDSNREIARSIRDKQFSVASGQIIDAIDEETRLNSKSAF
jgi:hypothetical protein